MGETGRQAIAAVEVDRDLCEVRRDGLRLRLEPKVFDVLAYLHGNSNRFVSKDELLGAVWCDVTVEDSSLSRCVYQIRKALGSRACIETRYGKGYRFVWRAPHNQQFIKFSSGSAEY